MPRRNALLDESKDRYWPLGGPWGIDKLRLQPSLEAVFDEARPDHVGKGDFLLVSTLQAILIRDILAGQFRSVQRRLVALFGLEATSVPSCPNCGVRL